MCRGPWNGHSSLVSRSTSRPRSAGIRTRSKLSVTPSEDTTAGDSLRRTYPRLNAKGPQTAALPQRLDVSDLTLPRILEHLITLETMEKGARHGRPTKYPDQFHRDARKLVEPSCRAIADVSRSRSPRTLVGLSQRCCAAITSGSEPADLGSGINPTRARDDKAGTCAAALRTVCELYGGYVTGLATPDFDGAADSKYRLLAIESSKTNC